MTPGFALLLAGLLGLFMFILGVSAQDDTGAATGIPALLASAIIVVVFAVNCISK